MTHAIFFALALMCAQFIHSALGDKGGGVQLVCEALMTWRGRSFLKEGRINSKADLQLVKTMLLLLSEFRYFLTRVVVYVGMCV